MAVVPRSFITLGASLLSARAAARLRREDHEATQADVFDSLIQNLARGSAWKAVGVEAGMSYESFQANVPSSPTPTWRGTSSG